MIASQDETFRFWAKFSAVVLAPLTVVASIAMMMSDRDLIEYDMIASDGQQDVATLGLTTIVALWVFYLVTLGVCLDIRKTRGSIALCIALFLVTSSYMLYTFVVSFTPWFRITWFVS